MRIATVLKGKCVGGAERDRTADLLVANEALSQLSYSPPPYSRLPDQFDPERSDRATEHAVGAEHAKCNRDAFGRPRSDST